MYSILLESTLIQVIPLLEIHPKKLFPLITHHHTKQEKGICLKMFMEVLAIILKQCKTNIRRAVHQCNGKIHVVIQMIVMKTMRMTWKMLTFDYLSQKNRM